MNNEEMDSKRHSEKKNDVNVNNNITLSINFGDSLNLLALIAGLFFIKRVSKQYKLNRRIQKRIKEKKES